MDNLKHMIVSEPTEGRSPDEAVSHTQHYGYGLNLYLDNEQVKTLGLTEKLEAGQTLMISAKGFVEEKSDSVRVGEGEESRMSIQITHLGIEPQSDKDVAKILYPDMQ